MRARAAVLGLAVLLAAGCGDSSSESSQGDRAPAKVAPRASPGCRGEPVAPAGDERVTTSSGGAERWYFRHLPPAYTGREPVPLVLDLHGYLEGAEVHVQHSQLGTFGDEQGFVTVTPHGQGDPVRWDVGLDSVDVAFVGDLLDHLEETLCVDERRVYATGLSNGAFMTSTIACVYADRVAAVAPVAGIRDLEGCDPARPVPVVAFHGTADTFVTFDGGLGEGAANLPAPGASGRTVGEVAGDDVTQGPSVPEITAAWAKRNGCDAESTERNVAEDVTLVRYDCPVGAEVELYRVEGGGHSWPGSEFSKAIESVIGHTTFSISANAVMWKFFRAHPLGSD